METLPPSTPVNSHKTFSAWLVLALGFSLWLTDYLSLPAFSHLLTRDWLGLKADSPLANAVEYFALEFPQVLMLLALIIFVMGTVQTFFSKDQIHRLLMVKGHRTGHFRAALLGILAPLDSCSVVPFFIGFVTAGIPLGVAFTFLVAAPLVNEVTLILLFGLLGWKVAGVYLVTGLTVALTTGNLIGLMSMDDQVEPWVHQVLAAKVIAERHLSWPERMKRGRKAAWDIVGAVWLYILAGMLLGAGIHAFVPESLIVVLLGKSAWWSVPMAISIGVPVYSNSAAMIPMLQALLAKGSALGTTLAFMMATTALSLPEVIMLHKVLRPKLIVIFVGVVTLSILIMGYLFNRLF